jgi:hypothetical protein
VTGPRRTVSPDQAAELLGVPKATIATWKHARRVTPRDWIRGRGRRVPLYDLEDLRPLAEAYLERLERRQTRRL